MLALLLATASVTAVAAAASASSELAAPALPLCTSCAAWCAGECSFPGPPLNGSPPSSPGAIPNPRTLQNVTLYRYEKHNFSQLKQVVSH